MIPINGNVEELRLGISDDDRALLTSKVQVIFHAAANVRFNELMSSMVKSNVRSLRCIIELAKSCPNLKALVHVSTAFSNCTRKHIEEEFYEPAMDPHMLIELAEKCKAEDLVPLTRK